MYNILIIDDEPIICNGLKSLISQADFPVRSILTALNGLEALANHFKGNAAYIGQIFKRDIHKSFSEYLKYVRIEKAKELLSHSNHNAKDIAQMVGFQNVTYFSTVFKEETGVSPAEYKRLSAAPPPS